MNATSIAPNPVMTTTSETAGAERSDPLRAAEFAGVMERRRGSDGSPSSRADSPDAEVPEGAEEATCGAPTAESAGGTTSVDDRQRSDEVAGGGVEGSRPGGDEVDAGRTDDASAPEQTAVPAELLAALLVAGRPMTGAGGAAGGGDGENAAAQSGVPGAVGSSAVAAEGVAQAGVAPEASVLLSAADSTPAPPLSGRPITTQITETAQPAGLGSTAVSTAATTTAAGTTAATTTAAGTTAAGTTAAGTIAASAPTAPTAVPTTPGLIVAGTTAAPASEAAVPASSDAAPAPSTEVAPLPTAPAEGAQPAGVSRSAGSDVVAPAPAGTPSSVVSTVSGPEAVSSGLPGADGATEGPSTPVSTATPSAGVPAEAPADRATEGPGPSLMSATATASPAVSTATTAPNTGTAAGPQPLETVPAAAATAPDPVAPTSGGVTAASVPTPFTPARTDMATPTAPAVWPDPVRPEQLGGVVIRQLRAGDLTTMTVRLDPAGLGAVRVEARLDGGHLSVHLVAEQVGTAARLESAMSDLRRQFQEAGLPLTDLDVSTGSGGQGRSHSDARTEMPVRSAVGASVAGDRPAGTTSTRMPTSPMDHGRGGVVLDL